MRNHFADELTQLADEIDNLMLLSGDIGNRLFNSFKDRHGQRFVNCGVAEGNMMSMAGGLALAGMRPVTYTITPFTTSRCFEQIRLDVAYHKAPVIIVGVGAGLSYASLGPTHHACEDVALLRALPNMTVVAPGDPLEVRALLRAALQHDGPVYMRLGKKNEPICHEDVPKLELGRGLIMREGSDVAILSNGVMLPTTLKAAESLEAQGVSTRVVSFHTVKPLDSDLLNETFDRFKVVVTVEEHSLIGGFGGAVAEWLVENLPKPARLVRMGTADHFMEVTGHLEYARKYYGLTAEQITAKALAKLEQT